jgi:hypothetical protein
MLIGSANRQEIEAFCAAASERGTRILEGTLLEDQANGLKNQARKLQTLS